MEENIYFNESVLSNYGKLINIFATRIKNHKITYDQWLEGYELFEKGKILAIDNRYLDILAQLLINASVSINTIVDHKMFLESNMLLQNYLLRVINKKGISK